jgi:hypothetical protein
MTIKQERDPLGGAATAEAMRALRKSCGKGDL